MNKVFWALLVVMFLFSQHGWERVQADEINVIYLPLIANGNTVVPEPDPNPDPDYCGFRTGANPYGDILRPHTKVTGPAIAVPLTPRVESIFSIFPEVEFILPQTDTGNSWKVYFYQGDINCLQAQYEFFYKPIVEIKE
jgi:hypothetical protein